MGCPVCAAPTVNHTMGFNPDCCSKSVLHTVCPVIDAMHCAARMAQGCDTANQVTNGLGDPGS